ncbi:MAG: MaoC family dehydratase N-terminal domain-containing protein [Thermoleophilia bacterium]|nr:MaoC family dehydratase N-terminal domain-containing protein [Thermoleophilia bacterium]
MAVRGVYTEAERRMLAEEAKRFTQIEGWHQPKRPIVATEEVLRRVGLGVDPWNPLWHDETYAQRTRWGRLQAFPTFLGFFGETGIMSLRAPAECGEQYMIWMGEDYEFDRPVLAGDAIRVYQHRPQLLDVTPLDGQGPRTYGLVEGDLEYFDHEGRRLGRLRNYVQRTFRFERPTIHPMPEYTYTKEELLYLGELMKGERIRGADTLYWEDVEVGSLLTPIVTGPTSMATNSLPAAIVPDPGDFFAHARQFFLASLGDPLGPEFIPDPTDPTGSHYRVRGGPMGRHYSDLAAQAEGEPCAWLFGVVSRFSLLRVLTNWMGDDGVVRRFCWRHMTRTRVGDAMVGEGRVMARRIKDGEHLVDLHLWLRNLRGNISEAALATVCLLSRGEGAPEVRSDVAAQFAVGDKVRLRPKAEWPNPPGFRFAGAEGTVVKWVEYDEPMKEFQGLVVCVRIDRASGEAEPYVGSTLMFLSSDLERV